MYFLLLGKGKGESEAPGRGWGSFFSCKSQEGVVVSQKGGGERPGGCRWGISFFWGGAKYFFSGRNSHQEGLRSSNCRKRRKWRVSLSQRHGLANARAFPPWLALPQTGCSLKFGSSAIFFPKHQNAPKVMLGQGCLRAFFWRTIYFHVKWV